jgi:NTP pyrophosphatase (non-canonical NTP hydrolase)
MINRLKEAAHEAAKAKGFHGSEVNTETVAYLIANLHGEVNELWEAYRKGELDIESEKAEEMRARGLKPLTFAEEEIADILIYLMDIAGLLDVDVENAVATKMEFNTGRPWRHGDKGIPPLRR